MAYWFAPSVDLEPNKDDTLDGIIDAMKWFDMTVPQGTIYATYRIAKELPDVIEMLAADHEIGVHVHPREFGHEHDQLAALDGDRQRELITETRTALADAASTSVRDIVTFRAGRHSASETTLDLLDDLNFEVDASVNVNYTDYMPDSLTSHSEPFTLDSGLLELPTTFGRPPLFSKYGLRALPSRTYTATAHTLRKDRRGTTGLAAVKWLLENTDGVSFYMHPYDATDYHSDLMNNGDIFRNRFASLVAAFDGRYLTASGVRTLHCD